MNLRLLTGYIGSIYWNFITPAKRQNAAVQLEPALWSAMQEQTLPNNKKILFGTYQSIALSHTAQGKLYGIWQSQQDTTGLPGCGLQVGTTHQTKQRW